MPYHLPFTLLSERPVVHPTRSTSPRLLRIIALARQGTARNHHFYAADGRAQCPAVDQPGLRSHLSASLRSVAVFWPSRALCDVKSQSIIRRLTHFLKFYPSAP
jgi:hypothetical protein